MAYFEFPHSRNYEGDLGWVIKKIIELTDRYNDFFEYNQITFADPLQWDITKQYPPYQIVFDYDAGYSYISKRPVPAGVSINNPDYWCLVGPLIIDAQARTSIDIILRFIANRFDSTNIATAVRTAGEYVVAEGRLLKITATINIGEAYTVGYNCIETTVENMIADRFPIGTADISDGAITTNKISNNAVTLNKLASASVDKSKMVADKYIFIGDSFNADYHYSWGKKIVAKLGLTLNSNAYVVATPGGGMGNGLILADVQALGNSLSSDEKMEITKIIMVFGANDWSQADANIINGIVNLENYLVSTFPNADYTLIAGQWGYENATYRQGLLNAYNIYAESVKKIRFVDKAFILMLDPYFVESDMVHPTDACTTLMASSIISIMNGGTPWNKYYSDLRANILTSDYGGDANITVLGDITPSGTHVYNKNVSPVTFASGITLTNTGTQIGKILAAGNNFFQRKAIIPLTCRVNWKDSGNNWQYSTMSAHLEISKHSDNDDYWDVIFYNDSYLDNSYSILAYNIYPTFDCYLDYCET